MSTENIEDYGAEPNPDDPGISAAERNLDALQKAADAAGDGGTIYVPGNTYYIGWGGSDFLSFGDREPKGISITGDGPTKSVLAVTEHVSDSQNCTVLEWDEGHDHGAVTVDNIKLDGNYENLPNLIAQRTGGIAGECKGPGTYTWDNVWVRGHYTTGVRVEGSEASITNCTFEDTAIGLENDSGGDRVSHHLALQPNSGNTVTVDSCEFLHGAGEIVDVHSGTGDIVLQNCWGQSLGTGVFKISAGNNVELRNSYMEPNTTWLENNLTDSGDFHGRALARRISDNESGTPTLVLDNVELRDCERHAIEARDYPLVIEGDMIAMHNAAQDSGRNSVLRDDSGGELQMNIGRLSVHNSDADVFSAPNADGSIDTIRRDNTNGLGETGSLSIGSDETGADPFAPSVPTQDEVGINSSGSDDSSGSTDSDSAPSVSWTSPSDGEAVSGTVDLAIGASDSEDGDDSLTVEYQVDGGSWTAASYDSSSGVYAGTWDTSGASIGTHTLTARAADSAGNTANASIDVSLGDLFADWTAHWASTSDDWSVASSDEYVGGHALAFRNDDANRARYAMSCDPIGTQADAELVDRFRVPSFTADDSLGFHARAYLRGSGSAGSESAYWIEIEDRNSAFRLGKYVNGDSTTLKRFGTPVENTWFKRRFRVNGDTVKAKIWPASESEPSSWDVELTDTSLTDGWVGIGSFDAALVETDTFSVATDGATAEAVESESGGSTTDSAPSVSWTSPSDGETVSGTVDLVMDASDAEDDAGTLTVEYKLDDSSWRTATYDTETDTYDGSWDSTAVADGSYTLTARVTDSAGNTANASIGVTADNQSLSISTVEARDVTETGATLVGSLDGFGSASEVDVAFEWRAVGADTWTTTSTQTRTATGEFSAGVSDLSSGTNYEFRPIATAPDSVTASTVSFQTSAASSTNSAPTVELFDVTDQSNKGWRQYAVDWSVADADSNLDSVITTLVKNGDIVAAESTGVSGKSASYSHVLRVRGKVDAVEITVNDTQNLTASQSQRV